MIRWSESPDRDVCTSYSGSFGEQKMEKCVSRMFIKMKLSHKIKRVDHLQAFVLFAASSMLIQPESIYDFSRLVSLLLIRFLIKVDEVSIGERLSKPGDKKRCQRERGMW